MYAVKIDKSKMLDSTKRNRKSIEASRKRDNAAMRQYARLMVKLYR